MPSFSKFLLATLFLTAVIAAPTPQLAGEGQAADALFTDTDNGVGYGTENAEDNAASLITFLKAGAPATRRQLDKISNGAQTVSNAVGAGGETSSTTEDLDDVDGTLTEGAANIGNDVGSTEEATLEEAGNGVPSSVHN